MTSQVLQTKDSVFGRPNLVFFFKGIPPLTKSLQITFHPLLAILMRIDLHICNLLPFHSHNLYNSFLYPFWLNALIYQIYFTINQELSV